MVHGCQLGAVSGSAYVIEVFFVRRICFFQTAKIHTIRHQPCTTISIQFMTREAELFCFRENIQDRKCTEDSASPCLYQPRTSVDFWFVAQSQLFCLLLPFRKLYLMIRLQVLRDFLRTLVDNIKQFEGKTARESFMSVRWH